MKRYVAHGLVVAAAIGSSVLTSQHAADQVRAGAQRSADKLRASQRQGCERGKRDRAANAAAWQAAAVYIGRVTVAVSVKEDVKRAARVARTTYVATAAELSRRAKIDCERVFP